MKKIKSLCFTTKLARFSKMKSLNIINVFVNGLKQKYLSSNNRPNHLVSEIICTTKRNLKRFLKKRAAFLRNRSSITIIKLSI